MKLEDRDLEPLLDEYWERYTHGEKIMPADEGAKSLLEIALQIREMSKEGPSPSFVEALRGRLLKRARELRPLGLRFHLIPKRLMTTVVTFLLALALLGGGTAIAAQNSLPGDILYPVKKVTEEVRLILNFHPSARVHLRLELEERRTREIEGLADIGHEVGASVLNDLAFQTEESMHEIEQSREGKETLLERLAALTKRQQEVLERVWEKVPEEAKPALERAMEASKRGHEQAIQAIEEHKPEEPPGQEKAPPKEPGPPEEQDHGKGK